MNAITIAEQVEAELTYLAPMTEKPFSYTFLPPGGGPANNGRYETRRVVIRNGRRARRPFTLDAHGFALIRQRSAVGDFDDEAEIRRTGYAEVEAAIRDATGAARVAVFDHTLRRRAADRPPLASGRQPTSPRTCEPAGRVHNDYTAWSAPKRVRDLMGTAADDLLARRFAIVNLWRAFGHPAFDAPLALCDARSIAPDDLIASDVVYPDRLGENYNARFNPAHAWVYFPRVALDEALLIKCHDSAPDKARLALHTAFEDPTTPAVAPPRQSIEFRTLAFFDA